MADWKKSGRRILITAAIAYIFFCACGCALQRKLLYFPTKISAAAVVQAAAEHGFAPWKNSAGQIIGWKIPASGTATGSVLIVHGNAGCAIGRGGRGALNVGRLGCDGAARPDRPSRCTLPITALRVTPPSCLAI